MKDQNYVVFIRHCRWPSLWYRSCTILLYHYTFETMWTLKVGKGSHFTVFLFEKGARCPVLLKLFNHIHIRGSPTCRNMPFETMKYYMLSELIRKLQNPFASFIYFSILSSWVMSVPGDVHLAHVSSSWWLSEETGARLWKTSWTEWDYTSMCTSILWLQHDWIVKHQLELFENSFVVEK